MLELPDDWKDQLALCDFPRVAQDLKSVSSLQGFGQSADGDGSDAAAALDVKLVAGFVDDPCSLTALNPIAVRRRLWKYFERHISSKRQ
jgi:hypothetical protein